MNRVLRVVLLCVVAAVMSAHTPINFVIVLVAALSLEEARLGDIAVIAFSAVSLDALMGLPVGLSVLPLAAMMSLIRLLKSQIYLQALLSRLVWLMVAVLSFYVVMGIQLLIRTGFSIYIWDSFVWGGLHSVVEGLLAAILSPYLNRYLTVTLEELRTNRDIICN